MAITETEFSSKFEEKAADPSHRGAYYEEDAAEMGMALIQVKFKDTKLYWMVDPTKDEIYSARFFAYGGKVSLGVAEALCSRVEGLTVSEACLLEGKEIESALRDDSGVPCVPESKLSAFANVDELLKEVDVAYPSAKTEAQAKRAVRESQDKTSPTAQELTLAEQAWLGLTLEEKNRQVNLVLDEKVRPALNADGGNVEVMDILDNKKIIIQYQGACGTCGSSLGATLSFIENTLRKEIYKDLVVVPNNYV